MKKAKRGKRERQKNAFAKGFSDSILYLKKNKVFFLIATLIFVGAIIFGASNALSFISPELGKIANEQVMNSLQEILRETRGMGAGELIGFIITNNVKAAFFSSVFGIFFSVFPIIMIVVNGYLIGYIVHLTFLAGEAGQLWKLFPHGVFEIPAILIGIGIGIKLGAYPFYVKEKVKGIFSLILSVFIFIILSTIGIALIVFISNPDLVLQTNNNAVFDNIFENIYTAIILWIVVALAYFLSIFLGLRILCSKDRQIVINEIKKAALTFIFIVIPLLIIAGIIEGLLIAALG